MSYYDFDGNKIDAEKWRELYYPIENRQFGIDQIGRFRVSTVWLGIRMAPYLIRLWVQAQQAKPVPMKVLILLVLK